MTKGAEKVWEEKSATFKSKVEKWLWIMKRYQSDIETAIFFLCTRVKYPGTHNWEKMRQVINFLSQTIGDDCVIGDEYLYEALTYVNASYHMHDGMRDHTGGCMTFGRGLIHAKMVQSEVKHKNVNRV